MTLTHEPQGPNYEDKAESHIGCYEIERISIQMIRSWLNRLRLEDLGLQYLYLVEKVYPILA